MTIYTPEMLDKLPSLKTDLQTMDWKIDEIETNLETIQEKRNALNCIIHDLEKITEFHNGIALSQWTEYGTIRMIAVPTVGREVEIYHNAHVPDKEDNFGWDAREYHKGMSEGKKWMGVGYTLEEAKHSAKEWITTGITNESDRSRL